MPAGRRGHKIREYERRIDSLLEDERERRQPTPPPISEEHAALRERIAETCAEIDLDPEACDAWGRPLCTLEGTGTALRALELMFEELELLECHGVDWRPYQSE
jgi:hypothetical protein